MADEDDVQPRTRERVHILTALISACEHRDRLIDIVSAAADGNAAREAVALEFGWDEVQATAALDLQVRRFTRRDIGRMRDEAAELQQRLEN